MANSQNSESVKKLLENLQSDLKNISLETRKKHPGVKESAEEAIVKIRNAGHSNTNTPLAYLSNQILYPLVQGCETKDTKVVNLCLQVIQRLITAQVLDGKGAKYVVETMWMLMEAGLEEVRLLQTLTLLATTNSVCCGESLARCLVICFRLVFSKDNTVATTAGATVRHLVSAVFDRAASCGPNPVPDHTPAAGPANRVGGALAPPDLPSAVADAYLLFQDLVQLVNADQPLWLQGIVEMTRTFGLELLEALLTGYSGLFYTHQPFRLLLKERVCSLVIKLFSPNIKYRGGSTNPGHSPAAFDKPYYPISLRLLRVVSVLVEKYYKLLVTECEIFLSLIVKFLDPDKPAWQRALALELLHRLVTQPRLLTEFCRCYDCQPHATNIFQDMINSLGAYVQNVFVSQPVQEAPQAQQPNSTPPSLLAGMPIGPGVSAQPGFYYRGVYQPLTLSWIGGTAKCQYLDMTERLEPPTMSDGYGVSLAYGCLLDVVRSVSLVIDTDPPAAAKDSEVPLDSVRSQLLQSSWCGLLAALALLLDASTEDSTAENILRSMCLYSSLAARLTLPKLRDSFITAVCKASLPPHYTLSVLKATPSTQLVSGAPPSKDSHEDGHPDATDYRHQVVAVGTPLPTASLPPSAQQGPVMLTAKNLQCMRSILSIAHCHGDLLGPAWHIVLTTLQHLVWILGLKPSAGQGGQLRVAKTSSETSAVLTTAVMADLPILANMLSNLFESSTNLSEESLNHLVEALITISGESLQLAYNNREPSLFAVAKLLETGIVNLGRVEVIWRATTSHLLEACSHPHARMREWGGEAVCVLIQTSLRYQHNPPLTSSPKLQTLLLSPLVELSAIPHPDIRARQLDCVMQVLHSSAEVLTQGWPLLITVIGSLRPQHSEAVVRTAFQALQLVLTDFLPLTPHNCLPLAVHTAAKFGSQTQDLNISLTAVGLLWNLSDYFYQNQDSLKDSIIAEPKILPDLPGYKEMSVFDKLWMCLFSRLGDLCLDPRPATRKSAGQTLFSTIAAHGSLLAVGTWQAVLWQVLFPLLDKVGIESGLASTEKSGDQLLIHHSRNTEHKQWAETQVLTISGVARVFVTKRSLLHTLGDFPKAWRLLLEHIEKLALSPTQEVSLAALKAFHEMVVSGEEVVEEEKEEQGRWSTAWKTWLSIGQKCTRPLVSSQEDSCAPTQAFLTSLAHIFPLLHPHIKTKLTLSDLTKLSSVIHSCLALPVQADSELGFLLTASDDSLLPLHSSLFKCISVVECHALTSNHSLIPGVFATYLQLCSLVHEWPEGAHRCAVKGMFPEKYILFGEKVLVAVGRLYEKTHSLPCVQDNLIILDIVNAVKTPLQLKYSCIKQSSWRIAIEVLLAVLSVSLSSITDKDKFSKVWTTLVDTLDSFLFPKVKPPQDRAPEQCVEDEAVDCNIIEFLKDQVLDKPSLFPHSFILSIMVILNKGSIHSHSSTEDINQNQDTAQPLALREDFAKVCFETLLQYSLLDQGDGIANGNGLSDGVLSNGVEDANIGVKDVKMTNKLAVTSLLHRFQEVLCNYIADEKLHNPVPLPAHRVSEMSFVLKAVATLISSLKRGQGEVDKRTWAQVISLYPHLVQATTTTAQPVANSLQQALHQYKDLLQPPS